MEIRLRKHDRTGHTDTTLEVTTETLPTIYDELFSAARAGSVVILERQDTSFMLDFGTILDEPILEDEDTLHILTPLSGG